MKNPARDIAHEHLQIWGEHEQLRASINGYPSTSAESRAREGGTVAPPCSRPPRGLNGPLGRPADPRALKTERILRYMFGSPDPHIRQAFRVVVVHYSTSLRGTAALSAAEVKGARQFRELLGCGRSYVAEKLREMADKDLTRRLF